MDVIYPVETEKVNLENYTLILPSISVGNVGQLAIDLLLNNLEAKNIACIHSSCFLPIVGADPFDPQNTNLTTSCQLYECKDKKLAIIQHRSPLVPSKIANYRAFLLKFIKGQKIQRTIMLCSSFSQFFTIEDIQGVPLHYLCSSSLKEEAFSNCSWKVFSLPNNVNPSETSAIPGGGIAKLFLEDCEREGIPLAILILVCSEGNNYPEAFQMVERLNDWLKLKVVDNANKWNMPASWTLPYGSGAPQTIY